MGNSIMRKTKTQKKVKANKPKTKTFQTKVHLFGIKNGKFPYKNHGLKQIKKGVIAGIQGRNTADGKSVRQVAY
jgi:hypothetical protein